MIGIVDLQTGKILEVGGFRLDGKCLRCGECCSALKHSCGNFGHEMVNGSELATCFRQHTKSWQCKFYPRDPENPDELFPGCGYRWTRIK